MFIEIQGVILNLNSYRAIFRSELFHQGYTKPFRLVFSADGSEENDLTFEFATERERAEVVKAIQGALHDARS